MVRLSRGLPRQAGSAKRLSALAGATSESPRAIDHNSRPSAAPRDATVRGLRARFNANLLHDVLGIIRSVIPTAELVNSRSRGAANSSAPAIVAATTLLFLLECHWPNVAAQRLDKSTAFAALRCPFNGPDRCARRRCCAEQCRCTSGVRANTHCRYRRHPDTEPEGRLPIDTVRHHTIWPTSLSPQTTSPRRRGTTMKDWRRGSLLCAVPGRQRNS